MKKTIGIAIAFIIMFCMLGCNKQNKIEEQTDRKPRPTVVSNVKQNDNDVDAPPITSQLDKESGDRILEDDPEPEPKVINIMTNYGTLGSLIEDSVREYLRNHPEVEYSLNVTYYNYDYYSELNRALRSSDEAPDIFVASDGNILDYTHGEMARYVCNLRDLGIDVNSVISSPDIADYVIKRGTRQDDGELVGFTFWSTSSCFFYRRSIAKSTWGTDDPKMIQKIIGGGSGKVDKFLEAAEILKNTNGSVIVSGIEDIYRAFFDASEDGWVVNGKFHLDPLRKELFSIARYLYSEGLCNQTRQWSWEWREDVAGRGDRAVFGFLGTNMASYSAHGLCRESKWRLGGLFGTNEFFLFG